MPKVEEVITALKKYETAEKVTKRLTTGGSCYCIQGVFCKAAGDLGLDIHQTDTKLEHSELNKSRFVYKGKPYYTGAPNDVHVYLGLEDRVSKKQLIQAGLLEHLSLRVASAYSYNWTWLNDQTEMSLAELIQLAISILKRKENVS